MKVGDRVFIADYKHPYAGCQGMLAAFVEVGVGRGMGWRIRLDENRECKECHAYADQLIGPSQAKSLDAVRVSGKFAARGQGR